MRKDIDNALPEQPTAAISAAQLLHAARHFNHPRDVLAAGDISKQEKRAILASWAFAIESIPALRLYPGTAEAVSYDEIIQALKYLDEDDMRTGEHGWLSVAPNVQSGHHRRPQARRLSGLGLCNYWRGDRRRQPLEM
ncbi:hypothetical protein RLEG3_03495 (plasmid) [Rhizobium leguminosarum bv. trifolii WSM1689]|uniref:hypothetical protein n=1 Tax=Rhizobium leguminosarum TaxID=384 RepID=UPI0003E0B428|nr:hypothetical protein [Rhizobium leguminosarum]AHF88167.1 hypothetical protein RLEG3_03495 [Rhizobium leguminosarum bv. trifolii WSM1689]